MPRPAANNPALLPNTNSALLECVAANKHVPLSLHALLLVCGTSLRRPHLRPTTGHPDVRALHTPHPGAKTHLI